MGNTNSSLPAGGKPSHDADKPQTLLVDHIRLHEDFIIQRDFKASEPTAPQGFDFKAEENEALARLRTPAFHEFHPSAWTLSLVTMDVHIQRLKEQEEEQLRSINSYLLWGPRSVEEKDLIDRHIRSLERDLDSIWDRLVICRAIRRLHAENTHRKGRWKSLGCACCEEWLSEAWSAGDGGQLQDR